MAASVSFSYFRVWGLVFFDNIVLVLSGRNLGCPFCNFSKADNQKMAMYCPQGSGTLSQQLLMMHGIAWYCMVLHGITWYCMVSNGIA